MGRDSTWAVRYFRDRHRSRTLAAGMSISSVFKRRSGLASGGSVDQWTGAERDYDTTLFRNHGRTMQSRKGADHCRAASREGLVGLSCGPDALLVADPKLRMDDPQP